MHFYYIENAKMTESYRAHHLLTSLAVVKRTCFDQSTGMWVRVQDENTAIICIGRQIIKTINARDICGHGVKLKSAMN